MRMYVVVNACVLENTVAHTLYADDGVVKAAYTLYDAKVTFVLDYNRFAGVRVYSDTYDVLYTARALVKFVCAL